MKSLSSLWLILPPLCLSMTLTGPTLASPPAGQQVEQQPDVADEQHRLRWRYPRFRPWQYGVTAVISAIDVYWMFATDFPEDRWNRGILFDDAVRDWLVSDTAAGRHRADMISDYLWYGAQFYPFVDSLVVPLATDNLNTDVAFQLTMLNLQALSVGSLVTRLGHLLVGRSRPSLLKCIDQNGTQAECDREGPSFFSGHTAMGAMGTGLTCAHHAALPLYGGGFPDIAICVVLGTATVANGTLRIVADKHWATDVLIGLAMGATAGAGLAYLTQYQFERGFTLTQGLLPPGMDLVPVVTNDALMLSLVGVEVP